MSRIIAFVLVSLIMNSVTTARPVAAQTWEQPEVRKEWRRKVAWLGYAAALRSLSTVAGALFVTVVAAILGIVSFDTLSGRSASALKALGVAGPIGLKMATLFILTVSELLALLFCCVGFAHAGEWAQEAATNQAARRAANIWGWLISFAFFYGLLGACHIIWRLLAD